MDDLTEPLAVQSPPRTMRPATIVGAAALVAVLAAVGALVWTFSGDSKKAANPQPKVPPATATAAPIAAAPAPKPAPAADPGAVPTGLPPGLLPGGATDASSLLGSSTMDAFAPTGAPTYANGSGSTPTVGFPKFPNLDWPAIAWGDIAPAVAAGVSGDALVGLAGNIGGWLTAAGVATANNLTDIAVALLIYGSNGSGSIFSTSALDSLQSLSSLQSVPGVADSIQTAVAKLTPNISSLPSTEQVAASAAALSSLPSLGDMPSFKLPDLSGAGLPSLPTPEQVGVSTAFLSSMPSWGDMPSLKLPAPPQVGLPKLPTPEFSGLPALAALNLGQLGQLPPGVGLPQPPPIGMPRIGLPRNPLAKLPSITKMMGFPF
ncbi:MAG: hypothetical protein HYZ38_19360 [Mycobacterium sp.]|nr:hypothetical protein [Mycobacterium sp.]